MLGACAKRVSLTLAEQYSQEIRGKKLRYDGVLLDDFGIVRGIWEAKDTSDDLAKEVEKKFEKGYPKENILFQSPSQAILYQNGNQVLDLDISQKSALVETLRVFLEYQPPAIEQWQKAVEEFKAKVPELAQSVLELLRKERQTNKKFQDALDELAGLCRSSINPNISDEAIEEMVIQHLLTERIFRKIFQNPDFINRNAVAKEMEKVIVALTSRSFSRDSFLSNLDRFYLALESAASTILDFNEKQHFLNTVYEKFLPVQLINFLAHFSLE